MSQQAHCPPTPKSDCKGITIVSSSTILSECFILALSPDSWPPIPPPSPTFVNWFPLESSVEFAVAPRDSKYVSCLATLGTQRFDLASACLKTYSEFWPYSGELMTNMFQTLFTCSRQIGQSSLCNIDALYSFSNFFAIFSKSVFFFWALPAKAWLFLSRWSTTIDTARLLFILNFLIWHGCWWEGVWFCSPGCVYFCQLGYSCRYGFWHRC